MGKPRLVDSAEMETRLHVAETAGAIIDLAIKIQGLISALPAGSLRDACQNAVTDILVPTTEAVQTGDAS